VSRLWGDLPLGTTDRHGRIVANPSVTKCPTIRPPEPRQPAKSVVFRPTDATRQSRRPRALETTLVRHVWSARSATYCSAIRRVAERSGSAAPGATRRNPRCPVGPCPLDRWGYEARVT
jgi:hypothetical protein